MKTLRAVRWITRVLAAVLVTSAGPTSAYTIWSTGDSYNGTGLFIGPGAVTDKQSLFPVVIHNVMFVGATDFVVPFSNNGPAEPNICAEKDTAHVDGLLSNGARINENVDSCSMTIAGVRAATAVINGGPDQGIQVSATLDDEGNLLVAMDLALDLNAGGKGVIRLPFYGTTGAVTVPYSLQTQLGAKGVDRAGTYPSGTEITGRIGDFNNDGWIDGSIVAVGAFPLDSPVFPGQPYAVFRYFETDMPLEGTLSGNVQSLQSRANSADRSGTSSRTGGNTN